MRTGRAGSRRLAEGVDRLFQADAARVVVLAVGEDHHRVDGSWVVAVLDRAIGADGGVVEAGAAAGQIRQAVQGGDHLLALCRGQLADRDQRPPVQRLSGLLG
jgi:hypothetical protein